MELPQNSHKDKYFEQAIGLYQKLTRVTKITETSLGISSTYQDFYRLTEYEQQLADAFGSNLRPNIEYCWFLECGDSLRYVEMLLEKYPEEFDVRQLKNRFPLSNKWRVYHDYIPVVYLRNNPGLELGARCNVYCEQHLEPVQEFPRLIKYLRVHSPYSVLFLTDSIRLESLEKLELEFDRRFRSSDMEKIQFLGPNITNLEVNIVGKVRNWSTFSPNHFTACFLSLEHLESLTLFFDMDNDWSEDQIQEYYSMVTTLMTADKPKLSHLYVFSRFSDNAMSIQLWNNIRNGFNFFEICCKDESFEVNKFVMEIKKLEISLIDVFYKFPHVKQIKVLTEDEAYKQRLMDELQVIRNELPRNRWLTLQFDSPEIPSQLDSYNTYG